MNRRPLLLIISFLLLFGLSQNTQAQAVLKAKGVAKVEWMDLSMAIQRSKIEKKKLLVMVYSDQCEWSQQMHEKTFSQYQVAAYLNENYYPVLFNINEERPITLAGKEYNRVRKSGMSYHEFTAYITMGRMSTPTLVFFDEELRMLQPIAGYKTPEDLELILKYYSENLHQQISWSRFIKTYSSGKE